MRQHRCVWHSLVYFLWLTHWEWLQDIFPLFLINPFHPPPPDSHIPHRDLIFSTQTMKEAKLERERIKFLICLCLLFQTSSMRQLPLSLWRCPSLLPSNLSPETRDTSNFTPSLFFRLLTSSSVAMTVWQTLSQCLRKFLILPRSWLVKTHTVTAQLILNFSHCCL